MKKLIILTLLLIGTLRVYSTHQIPDFLFYNGIELKLLVGWETPLQAYYTVNKIEYPFGWSATFNYKGHIASWVIENDRLFLKEVSIGHHLSNQIGISIYSKDSITTNEKVFANWYTGVIECERYKKRISKYIEPALISTYYFHIINGEIKDSLVITKKDMKHFEKLYEKDNKKQCLMEKYSKYCTMVDYEEFYFNYNYIKDSTLIIK